MPVFECTGDIFSAEGALAYCTASDFGMNNNFRRTIFDRYMNVNVRLNLITCIEKQFGVCAWHKWNEKLILHLITKPNEQGSQCTPMTLHSAIQMMHRAAKDQGASTINISRVDFMELGLSWQTLILPMLVNYFAEDVNLVIWTPEANK